MNSDDFDDPVAAALEALRERDVSAARASALRKRCHAALRRTHRRKPIEADVPLRRRLAPAVLVIVCALYVIETLRLAAGIGILW